MNCASVNDRPEEDAVNTGPPSIASQYALANLVRYVRHGAHGIELAGAVRTTEVLFIDDDTPPAVEGQCEPNLVSDPGAQDADVLYIGPE